MTMLPAGARIDLEITYLAMDAPPKAAPKSLPDGYQIICEGPPGAARFLDFYARVGAEYEWTDWFAEPEDAQEAYASNPARPLYVLQMPDGLEGGFFLLDLSQSPVGDLAYFGLLPAAIGQRVGRAFLEAAIAALWSYDGVERITVNTCTLDHPRALALYKSVGFVPQRRVWASRELTKPREINMRKIL